MADGEKSESDLIGEAKRAILAKIPGTVATSTSGDKVVKLAMAYTILDRGKLPGSDVSTN